MHLLYCQNAPKRVPIALLGWVFPMLVNIFFANPFNSSMLGINLNDKHEQATHLGYTRPGGFKTFFILAVNIYPTQGFSWVLNSHKQPNP